MFKKIKSRWLLSFFMSTMLFASSTSKVYGALGESAEGLANTSQSEALGLAEVIGLVGVVGSGILFFIGQRELAKTCIIGVVVGYFIIKYAQPIWGMFTGGI